MENKKYNSKQDKVIKWKTLRFYMDKAGEIMDSIDQLIIDDCSTLAKILLKHDTPQIKELCKTASQKNGENFYFGDSSYRFFNFSQAYTLMNFVSVNSQKKEEIMNKLVEKMNPATSVLCSDACYEY